MTDDIGTIDTDKVGVRPRTPRRQRDRGADQAETDDADPQSAGPASTRHRLETNAPSDCGGNDTELGHQPIEL